MSTSNPAPETSQDPAELDSNALGHVAGGQAVEPEPAPVENADGFTGGGGKSGGGGAGGSW